MEFGMKFVPNRHDIPSCCCPYPEMMLKAMTSCLLDCVVKCHKCDEGVIPNRRDSVGMSAHTASSSPDVVGSDKLFRRRLFVYMIDHGSRRRRGTVTINKLRSPV